MLCSSIAENAPSTEGAGWLESAQKTLAEGGEALPMQSVAGKPRWHVLWSHSNCEQLVCDQLSGKGFQVFLPRVDVWRRRSDGRRLERSPLFPGYLFLRHAMDKASYIEVRKARGLVGLLGERWDRLAVVPDREIESIEALQGANLPVLPHPYLREGGRVRVTRGALQGVEGILTKLRPDKGLLVLSVDLLRRSVAVEIDCTAVTAA